MIRSCLMTRMELKEMIMKSEQTEDGYYFCPRFKALVLQDGPNSDSSYYYDRYLFRNKICFSITDIKVFLATKDMGVDTDLITIYDDKIESALHGLLTLKIKDKVPNTDYTLNELIDTCLFILINKYGNIIDN